jgi:alpha-L-fucosidase 2
MSAMLGNGDQSLAYLNTLLDQYIQPNTMYQEGGSPVMETPLSGAQSVHDMLFTGWGGVIRVFPGVPSTWDVTVHDVAVEGGFLLSALRRGGVTQFVRVKSLAGEPCRVAPAITGPYDVRRLSGNGRPVRWSEDGGVLELDLAAGDDVVITTRGTSPSLRIEPVAGPAGNVWGLPAG